MSKQTRRRAISAEIVRQSNSHPERFKYVFKVEEEDGRINEIPQYGTDMMDALSSVMLKERTETITKVVTKAPEWALALAFFAFFGGSVAIVSQLGFDMEFIIISLGVFAVLGSGGYIVKNRLDKRSIRENE